MKKLRLILSVLAFVMAIGASFATKKFVSAQGYFYVSNPIPQCVTGITCDQGGSFLCTNGGVQQQSSSTLSGMNCGTNLFRSTP
jgi:hypothetical protein